MKKDKKLINLSVFFGILILFVVLISWIIWPWDQIHGGFLELTGRVIITVLPIGFLGLEAYKNWQEINTIDKNKSGIKVEQNNNQGNQAVVIGNHSQTIINQNSNTITEEAEASRKNLNRKLYLEMIKKYCQALNLAALGKEGNQITLDDVYIALDTTEREAIDKNGKEKDGISTDVLDRQILDSQPVPVIKAVARSKNMVILGAPGSGKSTFVKKLCGLIARALLKEGDLPQGFSDDLIPVLITLRNISEFIRIDGFDEKPPDDQKEQFINAFKGLLRKELAMLDSAGFYDDLHDSVRNGNCLLVLDGLDEVPYDLRVRVRGFVGTLIETYSPKHIIITCRMRSYSGASEIPGFDRCILAPFDEKKISEFVEAWYGAYKQDYPPDQIKIRKDDLTRAATSAELLEMASNPMLLTVMAIIHGEDVHLPPQKVKLYKRAVEILIRRWQKHKSGELSPSPRLEEFLKDDQCLYPAIERLAYHAQLARRNKKEDAPELLRKDALDLLERNECSCDDGYPLANEFLDYIDQRSGLLVGNGEAPGVPPSYSFPHRTFQEYLAGCYMASQRNFFRTIRPLAAEGDTWDVAVQMAFEELYHNRRGTYTLLEASYDLCKPCAWDDEMQQRHTLWAGQIANLIGKKEYEKDKDQPEKSRFFLEQISPCLIQVLKSCLPPVERCEAGNTLACLGDPRLKVMTIEEMRFCFVPEGKFRMGEDKNAGVTTLPGYWLGLHPISNAQYDYFTNEDGYLNPEWWVDAKNAKYWSKDGFKGWFDDNPRVKPFLYGDPYILPNHPVVGISWYEACAYALWLDAFAHKKGWIPAEMHLRMPIEQEWEKAACGGEFMPELPILQALNKITQPKSSKLVPNPDAQRVYPWIGGFNPDNANTIESGIGSTSALGCFPGGAGLYGNQDLAGNIWEWQNNWFDEKKKYKSMRGGSWNIYQGDACCADRGWDDPNV